MQKALLFPPGSPKENHTSICSKKEAIVGACRSIPPGRNVNFMWSCFSQDHEMAGFLTGHNLHSVPFP